ncbi:MAG: YbaY family lipoprotein [Candidatus Acidiferrales bacterium]
MRILIRGVRGVMLLPVVLAMAAAASPGQIIAPQARGSLHLASFRNAVPGRIPAPQEKPEPPASAANVVNGTATLRERMALPPGAYFEATLAEISATGAPDAIIATARVENPGNLQIRFAIAYDGARINAGRTYVVRASISAGGHALYISEAAYPVITHGNPKSVDIVLRRANGEAKPPVPEKTLK